MKDRSKNLICTLVAAPVILILLVAGVCKAYDIWMVSHLESSLTQSVTDLRSTKKRCDGDYEAVLKYKTENKLALTGTGNPCFLL